MARLCERPGCSQPAEVMYGIDADRLLVWIELFDAAAGYRAGVLCRRHADAMVVPLGWMLDDRREPVPRLFKTGEVQPPPPPQPRQRRHRAFAGDDTGQLELPDLDDADADVGEKDVVEKDVVEKDVVEKDVVEEPSEPWKPVFDQRDDLDGLLTARSPLLSRAFGKRAPGEQPEPHDHR